MNAKETYDAVWEQDKANAPDGDPTGKNPKWRPISILLDTNKRVAALEKKVEDLIKILAEKQ